MIPATIIDKLQRWQPRWSLGWFKITLGVLIASAFIIPLAIVAMPFIEFFNDMAAQPKAKTQMSAGRLYGQELQVERPHPVGAVSQDYVAYECEDLPNTVEDAKKAGIRLENPVPVDMASLERGRKLYDVYCTVCHGKQGAGDGPITGPERFPAPPSLHTDQAREYQDGTIYHIITKGTEKMPHYADKLEPEDRWNVINYVRALQRAMNPQPEDLEQ
jgi:mono/diheme cytochrome c family protein